MTKRKRSVPSILALSIGFVAFFPLHLAGQQKSAGSSGSEVEQSVTKKPARTQEDWTTLRLQNSSFKLSPPELVEKDDIPNTAFIRERLNVDWRATDPFDLYVIRPRGTGKVPVILYLYSFAEDTEKFKTNTWCERAVEGGYAAVGFVAAVTGHRTRYRLPKEWFVSEMQESLGSTVHDIQLILNYLATRKDLDMSHVGMFGSGSGGAIAILASAADSRIQVLDLLGPWGDWPRWIAGTKVIADDERPAFSKHEFLEKVVPLEPLTWLPKIQAKALRIQDVRSNKAMPDDAQEHLEAAAPDFSLINQYGNGRAFLASDSPGNLFQWMKTQLKAEGKTQVASSKNERVHFYPAIDAPAPDWIKAGPLEGQKPQADSKSKEKDKPRDQKD